MKLELVLVPSTSHGHLPPLVEFSKLLVDGHDHLCVTVIIIPPRQELRTPSISSYIASLSTMPRDRLRFIVLSDADRSNSPNTEPDFLSYSESYKPAVKATVAKLYDQARPDLSKLVGFVVDMFCTQMIDVANEFEVPSYLFYPSSAVFLGLQIHMQYLCDVEKYDVGELKDSDTELEEVPFLTRSLPAKCVPSVIVNDELPVVLSHARRFQETKGILIDTFSELEPQAVKFISGGDSHLPTVYAVGPVGLDSVDYKQTEVLRWLDDQPYRSVVFLCFGSMGGFNEEQAKEIAIALERTGYRFIWCLRRAAPTGPPREFTNLEEILPEGFLERTVEIGKVISWAPQRAVLSSPAIGGFVSHCGWNSILESVWFGVPVATLPLYAEQQLNAFEMVEEMGLAVEIRNHFQGEYMAAAETTTELIAAEEIERGIRCLMKQDSDVRDGVKKMSEMSHMAVMDGGSSHAALVKFIQDVTDK
ncbi:UDP-glycosyltransferase 71B2 [Raphanus sativus]|uniref:Glycosyltransferase n=1 Tax=Raphanus sativus TaxID=3726 RepID=A0A9W3DT70_RAPSA|nr:UDP-glycosyltransferase 71B2-like [Raphanus sativus]KAJ4897577.1 UDP-glycosyltransferase 71B2 [Raphanus sativus]